MRRFAFAWIAAVALTLFASPLLHREVFTLRDHTDYFQPLRFFTAEALQRHTLPQWNPYNASGEPWLANPQTGVFYPPAWLVALLPFAIGYMTFLFVHVLLLGAGTYLLFEEESPHAALAGATALMLSGPVLSLLDVQNNLATFAWIPFALWCAKRGRDTAGGFALAGAFLGGEPFFAAVGAALYACVVLRGDRNPRRLVYTGVVAFAVSAIQLLPFLAMLAGSDRRAGLPRAELLRDSMPPRDWLRVALPPRGTIDVGGGQHFIPIVYVGALVVLFALVAVLLRTRRVASWLALLATAFVVAGGAHLPLVGDALAAMPLTLFRYPARLVPFGALAIVAMMVHGLRAFVPPRLTLVVALAIALDLRLAVQPVLVSAPFRADVVPYDRAVGRVTKIVRLADVNESVDRPAAIAGYLNLYDRRFDGATAAPVVSQDYLRIYEAAALEMHGALDHLAAGYVLSAHPLAPPRFAPMARAGGITVYANRYTLPLVHLRGDDGRVHVVEMFSATQSTARVYVTAPVAGVVEIAQQAASGWRVFVDGKEAESIVVDRVFRGVRVTPGKHEIEWRYRTPLLVAGASITSLALVLTALRSVIARMFVKRA